MGASNLIRGELVTPVIVVPRLHWWASLSWQVGFVLHRFITKTVDIFSFSVACIAPCSCLKVSHWGGSFQLVFSVSCKRDACVFVNMVLLSSFGWLPRAYIILGVSLVTIPIGGIPLLALRILSSDSLFLGTGLFSHSEHLSSISILYILIGL